MSVGSPNNAERRLLAEYRTATQHYSWAVSELARLRGTVDVDSYGTLFRQAEDAFGACEKKRRALWSLTERAKKSK